MPRHRPLLAGHLAEGPYTYGAFGNCTTGGHQCNVGVAFKYAGRRLDPETGLHYYRARYYAPTLGRFLQTDPVGYKDDINWYTYVGNDPTDKTDPMGLTPEDRIKKAEELGKAHHKYVSGGGHGNKTDPKKDGLDCSGLARAVANADPDNKLSIDGKAVDIYGTLKDKGEFSTQMTDAKGGDFIFFKNSDGVVNHVGVVTSVNKDGSLKMSDANHPGGDTGIRNVPSSGAYGSATFAGVGRPIEAATPTAAAPSSGGGTSNFSGGGGRIDPNAGASGSWD